MLRNLPSHVTTEQLLEGIETLGFGEKVDFADMWDHLKTICASTPPRDAASAS